MEINPKGYPQGRDMRPVVGLEQQAKYLQTQVQTGESSSPQFWPSHVNRGASRLKAQTSHPFIHQAHREGRSPKPPTHEEASPDRPTLQSERKKNWQNALHRQKRSLPKMFRSY